MDPMGSVGIFRVWCFCPSTAALVFWIPLFRWHFWSSTACPVVFTTRSQPQLGGWMTSVEPNCQTIIKQIWWYTDNLFHLFFPLFNESWHWWLEQYCNDKPTRVLFCRGLWFFPWFSHGFPRFSPNVSATSGLYPLPPGQRRCGGWFGRGSWQGWRWGPQWWSADGRGCYLH